MAITGEIPGRDPDRVRPDRVGDLGREGAVAVAQQHRHRVVAGVGDGQVEAAITGEIPGRDPDRVRPDRIGDLGREGAVAVTQQHRHHAGAIRVREGEGEVEVAVAGEIPGHALLRVRRGRTLCLRPEWGPRHRLFRQSDQVVDLGREGAVPIAQQYRHRGAVNGFARRGAIDGCVPAGDGQIGPPVAIEVPGHDRARPTVDRVLDLGLERPIAVAQQDRHGAGVPVGDGQISPPVAVEVPGHDRPRLRPDQVVDLGLVTSRRHCPATPRSYRCCCWRRPGRDARRR